MLQDHCKTHPAACAWLLLPRYRGEGSLRGPQNWHCIACGMRFCLVSLLLGSLLLYFSNRKIAVSVLFEATLTTELSVHNDKWFPVLQVNLFSSCVQRQL